MLNQYIEPNPKLDARARRVAKKAGLRAEKSRVRNPHWNDQGGWQIVDMRNCVVAGSNYELTAEEVIEFCRET